MSKYRVELKTSRLLMVFQLVTYLLFVFSVLIWKDNVLPYQWALQSFLVCLISIVSFRAISQNLSLRLPAVIFSQEGNWLEVSGTRQISWQVTNQSRITSILLFVHLISPLDSKESKWRLIFKDQLNEQSFRRLCRVIIFQQQYKKD